MSTPSFGTALLDLIKSDFLIAVAGPLGTFSTAIQASNGDKVKQAAALLQLQANLVAEAPTALGGLESQLASVVLAKTTGLVATATAEQQSALKALLG